MTLQPHSPHHNNRKPTGSHRAGLTDDVSVSFYKAMLKEIDEIRGDTNRSLWLRRAAAKELERQKNEQRNGK